MISRAPSQSLQFCDPVCGKILEKVANKFWKWSVDDYVIFWLFLFSLKFCLEEQTRKTVTWKLLEDHFIDAGLPKAVHHNCLTGFTPIPSQEQHLMLVLVVVLQKAMISWHWLRSSLLIYPGDILTMRLTSDLCFVYLSFSSVQVTHVPTVNMHFLSCKCQFWQLERKIHPWHWDRKIHCWQWKWW